MTPAEHAELSAHVARAIGYYPESVRVGHWSCDVFRIPPHGKTQAHARWADFDYRAPSVALPLLEWLMRKGIFVTRDPMFPDWVMVRGCPDETDRSYPTLAEAIARAVAAVEGGLNAMRQQLIAMHAGVNKRKAALKRLKRGELHRSIIEAAISEIERRVEAAEREVAVGLRCIELLREGEFAKPVGYAAVHGYYTPGTATMYATRGY